MASLRRFLLLLSLSFAFGGFFFYAAVVVPIGSRLLGTTTQGFVTREVTHVLNIATLVAVLLIGWELRASWTARSRTSRSWLSGLSIAMGVCSLSLIGLHARMDQGLLAEQMAVLEPDSFYQLHRVYLWLSTFQWLASLPSMWLLFCGVQPAPPSQERVG